MIKERQSNAPLWYLKWKLSSFDPRVDESEAHSSRWLQSAGYNSQTHGSSPITNFQYLCYVGGGGETTHHLDNVLMRWRDAGSLSEGCYSDGVVQSCPHNPESKPHTSTETWSHGRSAVRGARYIQVEGHRVTSVMSWVPAPPAAAKQLMWWRLDHSENRSHRNNYYVRWCWFYEHTSKDKRRLLGVCLLIHTLKFKWCMLNQIKAHTNLARAVHQPPLSN